MNIVGEGFHTSIIKQVKQRQEIYGSINRDNEQLSYLNARTGWCKLISSVNVDDTDIRGLGLGGNQLASRFVLFGGVYNEEDNIARSGIWQGIGNDYYNASTPNNAFAYGIGGTEFGLNAMPGIIQATIKTETMGSIKTATVTIRANNRNQFDIIDILYLRLGFTTLLEWGNSSYYDNNGNYITDNPYSLTNDFLSGKMTYDNALDKINNNRIKSNGNYDALFGKVVNFNWTFTNEGAYDITVKIIGYGDVIESIKANSLLPTSITENTPGFVGPTQPNTNTTVQLNPSEETIETFSEAHEIGRFFSKIQKGLQDKSTEANGMAVTAITNDEAGKPITGYKEGNKASVIYFKQIYENATTGNGNTQNQYYIKLGYFLYWLQENIIPYVNDPKVRMLKIDYDVKTNIIYVLARQTSIDPGVCTFQNTFYYYPTDKYYYFCDSGDIFEYYVNDNKYGYIMNSYFNMAWILQKLEDLKDEKGNVNLFDLLDGLCQGWNNATGNFNTLKPVIDTETHTIKIIDETPLPDRDVILRSFNDPDISTETAVFDVYRYTNQNQTPQAGFIRNFNFNTTVAPNLATLITVGATSNGYVVGQDATALSRMNAGLTDRIKKQVGLGSTFDVDIATASSSSLSKDYQGPIDNFNEFVKNLASKSNQSYPIWNQEAINNFSNTAITFYEYDQAKQTQEAANILDKKLGKKSASSPSSPNIGFLPFDAQITMDGLSGMKVYQKFTIDSNFLPSNYPESLEFLIKGITNTISNNEWLTTLDSIAIPKNPFGSVLGGNNRRTSFVSIPNNYPVVNTTAYPNVTFQDSSLGNPTSDKINPSLLSDISKAAQAAGLNVVVTTAVSGHNYETKNGQISRHGAGNAVDISIIDGIGSGKATNSTNGNAQFREKGNKLKNALVSLGYAWNSESGQTKSVLWQTDLGGNHYNHIHVSRRT